MQQRDGNRFDALLLEMQGNVPHLVRVDRRQHCPVGQDAFVQLQPQPARDEWFGQLKEDVIQIVAMFLADLDSIAKTTGRDQRCRGTLALDDRVGDERRAMHDAAHRCGSDACVLQRRSQAFGDSPAGIIRRRQNLSNMKPARIRIQHHDVGERPTNINSNPNSTRFPGHHDSFI